MRTELPPGALLARYAEAGDYTDCYATEVPGSVAHADYVAAFYTSFVFKAERLILRALLGIRSSDAEARALAAGTLARFSAWNVEARAPDQLLMADYSGRTRSWLMSSPLAGGAGPRTRLYFGSAVLRPAGRRGLGQPFRLLLGFHKLYSRILLRAARARLRSGKLR